MRSPVLGYNHNLKYRGRVFHVQTEDSGPGHPRIFTHLYFGGSIVASKKHEYDAEAPADIVKGLMQSQHKSILRDLKNGRHDAQLELFFSKRGEKVDAPDDSTELTTGAAASVSSRPGVLAADAAAADPPSSVISAASNETPTTARHTDSVSPEVLAQFEHAFDDEPASAAEASGGKPESIAESLGASPNQSQPAAGSSPLPVPTQHVPATIPVRPIPPSPSAASATASAAPISAVRVERTVPVGQVSPSAVGPAPTRPRRPGHSIPYIVQQGSHPVATAEGNQEIHVPTLTMPAAPIIPRAKRPTEPGAVAKAEAARASSVAAPASENSAASESTANKARAAAVAVPSAPPASPPLPLDPSAGGPTAPLTAATVGALPTEVVSREDNQSLDEVIMAYLARGVEDEQKNVGG